MKADRGDLQVLAVIATAHSPARGWAEVAEAGPAAHPHGAIGIDSITSTRLCRFVTLLPETAWRVVLRCLFAAGCGAWPPGGGGRFSQFSSMEVECKLGSRLLDNKTRALIVQPYSHVFVPRVDLTSTDAILVEASSQPAAGPPSPMS